MSRELQAQEPRLHQSIAKILVTESPLEAWWQVFGGAPAKRTDATDIGEICHGIVLGQANNFQVLDLANYKTANGAAAKSWVAKEAKAAWEAVEQAGRIPIAKEDFAGIEALCHKVGGFLLIHDMALSGASEQRIEWEQDGILCAGRLDHHWCPSLPVALDLKFVEDVNPAKLARAFVDYGYDIQWAAYTTALGKRYPDFAGRIDLRFVFVQKSPPHDIVMPSLSGMMKSLGLSRWARAIEIWSHCLATYGTTKPWPGYSSDERLEPPKWVVEREAEASAEFIAELEKGIEVF